MPEDQDKVDTVPPPAGEDDAYSAPTKVGPMTPEVVEAMRRAGVDVEHLARISAIPKPAPLPPPIPREEPDEPDEPDEAAPESEKIESQKVESQKPPSQDAPSSEAPREQSSSQRTPAFPAPRADTPVATEANPRAEQLSGSDLVPRVYDEADEDAEDNAPTKLHPNARPFMVPIASLPPIPEQFASKRPPPPKTLDTRYVALGVVVVAVILFVLGFVALAKALLSP